MDIEQDFGEIMELLKKELEDCQDFYDETKNHFNTVKSSRGSGTLSFIHQQTANLVGIKSHKESLIKDMISVRKNLYEIKIKQANSQNGSLSDVKNKELATEFFNVLLNNRQELVEKKKKDKTKEKNKLSEEEVNKKLEERYKDIQKKKDKKKQKEKPKKVDYTFVVDLEKNIYAMDKDYNILEDIKTPKWKIRFEGEGENIKAYNEEGKELEVIIFEE